MPLVNVHIINDEQGNAIAIVLSSLGTEPHIRPLDRNLEISLEATSKNDHSLPSNDELERISRLSNEKDWGNFFRAINLQADIASEYKQILSNSNFSMVDVSDNYVFGIGNGIRFSIENDGYSMSPNAIPTLKITPSQLTINWGGKLNRVNQLDTPIEQIDNLEIMTIKGGRLEVQSHYVSNDRKTLLNGEQAKIGIVKPAKTIEESKYIKSYELK